MTLRIGTRKSALALWQAERVQGWLRERGEECELVPMSTEGDRIVDRPLAEVGGKGLFVKELEQALHEGRADLAVHSAKDVPFALPEGFVLSAFPVREDPRDALIAPFAKTFENLPRGARVGTSSLRRAVQLLAARPDLVIVPVRGTVHTRLARATGAKVLRGGVEVRPADGDPQGPLDGVVLALAGLRRLGLEEQVTQVLPVTLSLPSAGQGALAIEAIQGSAGYAATTPLDDASTARCVRAERAVLQRLSGSCTVPVAAYAVLEGGRLWLRAVLGGPDGRDGVALVSAEARGDEPEPLGRGVAEALLAKGGAPLLEAARAGATGLPAPKRA
ncbi:MAG TPA: hydroxymethylbilane synthase [Myxococcales bacterium]|nr:hydroxymethylbilane synthase [Myxococcales bacterium]